MILTMKHIFISKIKGEKNMIELNVQRLSKSLNYTKALDGVKLNQTGIINITKENQKEITKYINIQTNESTGYEKIDLEKPINVGEVDMAKYGKSYYDLLDNQGNKYDIDYVNNKVYEITKDGNKLIDNAIFIKDENNKNVIEVNGTKINVEFALKEGISIMIQKNGYDELGNPLENSTFDIYPNPNPYTKYKSVKELSETNTSLKEKKEQILTGIDIIDNSVEMYIRTDKKTKFMKVEDVLKQLDINLITPNKEQLLKPGSYVAIETNKDGQQFLSHGINCDINGNPIGYSLKENQSQIHSINQNEFSSILNKTSAIFDEVINMNIDLKNKNRELESQNKELLERIQELESQSRSLVS